MPEINEDGQEKLLNSSVAIVGAGGLGCPVGLYLAGAGIGSITIIDNDSVEISNLNRQIAFSTNDIGFLKSECLKKAIEKINPDIKTSAINERLDKANIKKILYGMDVVVDCTDNHKTRFLLAQECFNLNIPMSFGSAVRQEGQTAFFQAGEKKPNDCKPCYICIFPENPENDIISRCSEAGILGPVTGLVSSIQSLNIIRYLIFPFNNNNLYNASVFGDVVELVDTPGLEPGAARRVGSTPSIPTI